MNTLHGWTEMNCSFSFIIHPAIFESRFWSCSQLT